MANNFRKEGKYLDLTAPADVDSGELVVVGEIFGVAMYAADNGGEMVLGTGGVWELTKLTGGSSAWTEGVKLYYDKSAKKVQKTTNSNTVQIGVAAKAAADGDATGWVRLNDSFGV